MECLKNAARAQPQLKKKSFFEKKEEAALDGEEIVMHQVIFCSEIKEKRVGKSPKENNETGSRPSRRLGLTG